jgi:hypothetical protein
VRRLLASLVLLAPLAVATGCGNERQAPSRLPAAAPPEGGKAVSLARYGVSFRRPANWTFTQGRPPQLAQVYSGQAAVAMWRYRREEALPGSAAELARARRALVAAARARDRSLRLFSVRPVRVGGAPGVELVADERIGLVRRKVRSTHLYAHGAELVIDAYAPPDRFSAVDRAAFLPLLRSLRVTPPRRR